MKCIIDSCDRTDKLVRGMCSRHYQQWRKANPEELASIFRNAGKDCSNEECTKAAFVKGLCKNCYRKQQRWGDPNYGKKRSQYQRSRIRNQNGYIQYYSPDSPHATKHGWVYEHREVMGEHIGRPLLKEETVHHKNGVRDDNRIENLELWSRSQPSGQRVEDKISWAKEILVLYGVVEGKIFRG